MAACAALTQRRPGDTSAKAGIVRVPAVSQATTQDRRYPLGCAHTHGHFLGGSFLCNLVLTQLSALQPLTVLSSSTAHGEPLTASGAGCQVSACARLGWDGASRFPVTGQQAGSPALSQAKEVKTQLSRAHPGSVQSTASRTWALAAPHPGPDSGTEGSPSQSRLPWGVDREVSHRLSTLISS